MAVVLDSLTATFRRTAFIKPPDMVRQVTAIPRAIVTFEVNAGVISAKPLDDTAELIIGMSVDFSFAYRWIDLMWSLDVDAAFDWNNRAYLEITNAIRNLGNFTLRHVVVCDDVTVVPGPSERIIARTGVDPVPGMRYIMQVIPGSAAGAGPIITFKASNETAAASLAGTTNFYASMYEYDIEQVETFPIHYAQLTLDR